MSDIIESTPIEFPSSDGVSTLHGTLWLPSTADWAARPRGIVQIVHGMAEHHGRYDAFGRMLAENGFAACAHDHIGHGRGGSDIGFGNMDAKLGETHMVDDVDTLRRMVSESFPADTPYFIFGHSMGSLVTRVYLAKYGAGLTGAVLCGTAHEPGIVSAAGNLLARAIVKLRGNGARSKLLHSLADGAYSKAIKNAETPLDWLSVNKENVQAFMNDELSGFTFTAGGYATLTALAHDAASAKTAQQYPKDLPLLFIAGTDDPVGNMGKGVEKAVDVVKRAGVEEVELILYDGMRHEILNETDNQRVYDDVLRWLERQAKITE